MDTTRHVPHAVARAALTIALFASPLAGCGSSSGHEPSPSVTPAPTATVGPLASPGRPDPTFGTGGIVRTPFSDLAGVRAVAVQPDGRIVAAGAVGGDIAVARYRSDGQLDEEFGGGVVRLSLAGINVGVNAIALQPDGAVVLGGFSGNRGTLIRLTSDGAFDATFGDGGTVLLSRDGDIVDAVTVDDVALQSDGRIVATVRGGTSAVLVRRMSDGSPDPSFGTNGTVSYDAVPFGVCWFARLAVREDDALLAGGRCVLDDFLPLLVLYPPDANTPPSVLLPIDDDDQITFVEAITFANGAPLIGIPGALRLARFDDQGRPQRFADASIGRPFPGAMHVADIAVDTAGRIVVSGTDLAGGHTPMSVLSLMRFTSDGALDPSFGINGSTSLDAHVPSGLALQPDGKIVVSALFYDPYGTSGPGNFTLLRYQD
jgi:uncharacterized delta-60 repeat protein